MPTPNFSPAEKTYILGNYEKTTVPAMASHLKRGAAGLYSFLKENGLSPYKDPDGLRRPASHPFRANNRKLENYHAARQAQRNRGEIADIHCKNFKP